MFAVLFALLLAAGCSDFSETAEIINPATAGNMILILGSGWEPVIEFSGIQDPIAKGSSMTVSVTVDPEPDSIEWYVDGSLVHSDLNGTRAVFGAALKSGLHSVSMVARRNGFLASGQFQFTVNPAAQK
jgi:hypothetical protein